MNTMKTIWNKVPGWGKALIFLGVLGMPVRMLIYGTATYNLQQSSSWGWSLLVAIPLLFLFWQLVSRWSPFNQSGDVKISLHMNLKDVKVWSRLLGLVLVSISTAVLFTELFDVQQDHQMAFFETFRQFGVVTALPLIVLFALTAGIVEEVVFRAYVQNSLVRAYPKVISFLVIGLVFALAHRLPLPLVFAFLIISTSFSLVADEFKSLGVVIVAHVLVDLLGLLEVYFDLSQGLGSTGIAIAGFVFPVSLFLLINGNKSISFLGIKKLSRQA